MSSIKVGNTFETNNYGQVKVVHVGRKDITVRFKDGTDVITESSHLYSGSIKNPNAATTKWVGKRFQTNNYGFVVITKYVNNREVTIKFESDGTEVLTQLSLIERGKIKNPNAKDAKAAQWEGNIFPTNRYGNVKVLKYVNASEMLVEFESDGTQINVSAGNLRKGKATNPNSIKKQHNTELNAEKCCEYDDEIFETNRHGNVRVIKYTDALNVLVEFEDGTQVTATSGNLRNGKVKNPNYERNKYFGKIFESNNFGKFKVIKFVDSNNVTVKFADTGTKVKTTVSLIKSGSIKDYYCPSVFGVGYLGIGDYSTDNKEEYNKWKAMLGRCYSQKVQKKQPSYIGCTVHEDWHNFQFYCEDITKKIGYGKGWDLDKDTIYKNNKVYSDDTTCFLPPDLNYMLVKRKAERGLYYIGVHLNEELKKPYMAQCGAGDADRYLGSFATELEAFEVYAKYKEKVVRERTKFYKDQLDPRAYKALLKYKVENG